MVVRALIAAEDPGRITLDDGAGGETEPWLRDQVLTMLSAKWVPARRRWTVPLVWSSCVVLRGTFGDQLSIDPSLAEWARAEKRDRVDVATALSGVVDFGKYFAAPPPGDPLGASETVATARALAAELGLFPHQAAGAAFMATAESCLIADETGTGKSAQTIAALRTMHRMGREVFPALVIAPNSVKTTWCREFEQWWPGLTVLMVEGSAAQRRKVLETPAHVYVVNHEQMHRHSKLAKYGKTAIKRCPECGGMNEAVTPAKCQAHDRELNQVTFKTVVVDECFVAGTVVSTPRGERAIETLREGDIVYGYDHETRRVVETAVSHAMQRQSNEVIDELGCTPSHPYWTENAGYRPAGDLIDSDKLYEIVRDVRNARVQLVSGADVLARVRGQEDEEGRAPLEHRLDSLEVLEPRDRERYERVRQASSRDDAVAVYNVETGTSNYFAGGVLVHNCHRIKSPTALVTRAMWAVGDRATYRFGLTGTPIQDNVDDLWPLLRFVSPEEFPGKTKFMARYANEGLNSWGIRQVFGLREENRAEYDQLMQVRFRRMLKEVVLPFLPPLVTETRYVDMPAAQAKAYRDMKKLALAELGDDTIAVTSPLSKATRLLQFASSYAQIVRVPKSSSAARSDDAGSARIEPAAAPFSSVSERTGDSPGDRGTLSRDGSELADSGEALDEWSDSSDDWSEELRLALPSNKVSAVLDDIEAGDFGDSSLVVFAVSRQLIELLSEQMTKRDMKHGLITGGQGLAERQQAIDDFQSGKTKYVLLTIAAGGVGLTLTAADTMIGLQRSWSSVLMTQMLARAHRIGSEKHERVTVVNYVTRGTIEEKQLYALADKSRRIEDVLRDRESVRKFIE